MKKIRRLKRVSGFLITTFVVLLWFAQIDSKEICIDALCRQSNVANNNVLSSNLVQTFETELTIYPQVSPPTFVDFRDPGMSIGLSWREGGRLLLTVPMRNGGSTAFGYTTPKGLNFENIVINVHKSSSIVILIDGKIAYAHKYENAPFFKNVEETVSTPNSDGNVRYKIKSSYQTVENKASSLFRIVTILAVTTFFTFLSLILLRRLFPDRISLLPMEKLVGKPVFGAVFASWIVSMFVWLRKPIDLTGAENAGPFGPLGPSFSDFFQLSQVSQFDRPYDLGASNYPPTSLFFLRLITSYDPNQVSYFVVVGLILGALIYLFCDTLKTWKTAFIFMFSFPFIFAVIRGNLDLLAIYFSWIAVLALTKRRYLIFVITLGIAISLKIWPIIFILILFKRRRWVNILQTLMTASVLTGVSSFLLGYRNIVDTFRLFTASLFDQSDLGTYALQSTFSMVAIFFVSHIFLMARNPLNPEISEIDNSINFINGTWTTLLLILLILLFIYFFMKVQKLSTEFLILASIALLIPTQSFTYRGMIVLFYFYLISEERNKYYVSKNKRQKLAHISQGNWKILSTRISSWSVIPIFAPTTFYFIPGTQFSTASIFQPLGLLTFVTLSILAELHSSLPGSNPPKRKSQI